MNHLYFAYGSNLDRDQMAERCPESDPLCVAHLRGYRLVFGGHSPNWDGAPATVVPDEGTTVPGLIYRITETSLEQLDTYEGHPVRYERRLETVFDPESNPHEAHVYIKELEPHELAPPPDTYMQVLKEAYDDLGFDASRLERAAQRGSEVATSN